MIRASEWHRGGGDSGEAQAPGLVASIYKTFFGEPKATTEPPKPEPEPIKPNTEPIPDPDPNRLTGGRRRRVKFTTSNRRNRRNRRNQTRCRQRITRRKLTPYYPF